ncbi:MAG: N-acetylmuramoyl-L-alanine amidase, partial [Oscillospiraceae bacterium]|nr:N-acetylmuramoyl-L-alanine amidase [Oscillospiraceae bacterium]
MAKTVTESAPITEVNGITVNKYFLQTINCTVLGSRAVKYIVMHYTGNSSDTALANAKYFYNNANLSASAHYIVDDTSIYQSTALKNRAWHCGASTYWHDECRNANSIGIEMACTAGNYRV